MILGWQSYNMGWGSMGGSKIFLLVLLVWELYWKGHALWRAANKKHKEWFIALLIVNSLGILPLLYLYYFSKDKKKGKK